MTTVATASPYAAGREYQGSTLQNAFGVETTVAYGLLLSSGLKEWHRDRLRRQLLRYSKLASLAMVLAWAGLRDLTQPAYGT